MKFFSVPLQSQSGQGLSSDRLMTARGLTNLVMTSKEKSVQRGAELDDIVRRPDYIVSHLKKRGLLPKTATCVVVELPDKKAKRTALFGVEFYDLAQRQQAICDEIDQPGNEHISPLMGFQTVFLLTEMLAHAYVANPESIKTDALVQQLCKAVQDESIYVALMKTGGEHLTDLIYLLKEQN